MSEASGSVSDDDRHLEHVGSHLVSSVVVLRVVLVDLALFGVFKVPIKARRSPGQSEVGNRVLDVDHDVDAEEGLKGTLMEP